VLVVRRDGEILFANRPLGDTPAESIVGSSLLDWIPLQQQSLIEQCLEQVFVDGTPQRCELAGLRNHAPDAWYDCRLNPNVREGAVVSATLVAHDITEYKATTFQLESTCRDLKRILDERTADLERTSRAIASEAQSQAEEAQRNALFREMLDFSGEAIFVIDGRTARVVDLNATAAHWLGRPVGDAVGTPIRDLGLAFPVTPLPDPSLEFTETRDTRRPTLLSGVHRRQDGTTFPVEVAVATHVRGKDHLILAVARDVKDRLHAEDRIRESEERYDTLFDQCWDAIYLTSRGGRVERINSAAAELFGYAANEFVGLDGRELFGDPKDIQRFQVQMSTVGAVSDLEVELVTRRGDRFTAMLSATRQRTADGTVTGYQCIVRPLDPQTSVLPSSVTERCVIVVGRGDLLTGASAALATAGLKVVHTDAWASAAETARRRGDAVVGIVGSADAPGLRPQVESMRRAAPSASLILVTQTDPVAVAEHVADLGVHAILPDPVHPLTLLQRLRER
jgi:PAS domain S-box-containing protein